MLIGVAGNAPLNHSRSVSRAERVDIQHVTAQARADAKIAVAHALQGPLLAIASPVLPLRNACAQVWRQLPHIQAAARGGVDDAVIPISQVGNGPALGGATAVSVLLGHSAVGVRMTDRAQSTTTMARLNHIGAIWYSGPRNGAIARCKIARQLRPAATVVQAQHIRFSMSVIGGIPAVHGYVATTAFHQHTDVPRPTITAITVGQQSPPSGIRPGNTCGTPYLYVIRAV